VWVDCFDVVWVGLVEFGEDGWGGVVVVWIVGLFVDEYCLYFEVALSCDGGLFEAAWVRLCFG